MRGLPLVMILAALALPGCLSTGPVAGAERGRVYSLAEFEEALLEEKAGILEAELRRVRYFGLSEQTEVTLSPVSVPEYPLLAEWMQVRPKSQAGDEVWEYLHRGHTTSDDDAGAHLKRGYALVRDGRILAFMPVDGSWCIEY